MKKNRGVQVVVALIVWSMVFVFSRISSAESVYNFYFNPEVDSSLGKTITRPVEKESQVNNSVQKINYYEHKKWRLTPLFTYVFKNPTKRYESDGVRYAYVSDRESITVQGEFIPNRYFGVFGGVELNGIDEIFKNKKFNSSINTMGYLVGAVVTPINLTIFGLNDVIQLGGEFGWDSSEVEVSGLKVVKNAGSYERTVWDGEKYIGQTVYFDTAVKVSEKFTLGFFGGFKLRVNLSSSFSADASIRRSIEYKEAWQSNAGLSYHF